MKKAMIISVGTGRTGEDIANAICFSIQKQNPDYIVFVLTDVSKKTLSYVLQNPIATDKKYIEKYLSDENDVERISIECTEFIKEIIKYGYKPQDIVCDYTSGTKAMSAGLILSAINNNIGTLVYISGKRDKEGRVISGTERAILLSPNIIFAEKIFDLAVNLFNKYQYDECIENLKKAKDLFKEDEFQDKCNILIKITESYSNWDKFNLEKAFQILNNLPENKFLSQFGIKSRVEKNKENLYQEINNKFSKQRIADLLENAKRRGEESKFDDAVARLYRLIEYIAQIRINEKNLYKVNNKGNIDTSKIDLDKLPDNLKEKYRKPDLALVQSYELIKDLGDEVGIKFMEKFNEKDNDLKKFLGLRNNSILAHGFNPLSENTYKKMLNFIEEFIRNIYPDIDYDSVKFPKIKF